MDEQLVIAGALYRLLVPISPRLSSPEKLVDWVKDSAIKLNWLVKCLDVLEVIDEQEANSLNKGVKCTIFDKNLAALNGWIVMEKFYLDLDKHHGQSVDYSLKR